MKRHNLHWKLLSILLAMLLWLIVINIQNPVISADIDNIKVDVIGLNQIEGKGHVVKDGYKLHNLSVNINIKGQRLEVENFLTEDVNSVTARINLTPYVQELVNNSGLTERLVEIEIDNVPEDIVIEDYEPSSVYVVFESEKTESFDIIYNINGKEDSQYITLDPIIKTKEIEIVGPESIVDTIKNVVVDININDFAQDPLVMDLPVFAYDKDGNEVVGISKSQNYVEVILPTGKKKVVPLVADFNGTLPTGYTLTNTIITPAEITIVGNEALIDQINSIQLNSIFLSNIIENTTKQVDFLLPDGVEYIDKIDPKAVVTIEVQKTNIHEFTIDIDELKLKVVGSDNIKYDILDNSITLKLSGTAEEILEFTVEDLSATLDLTDAQLGKHEFELTIPIPPELEIVNSPSLTVLIEQIVSETPYEDPAYIDPIYIDPSYIDPTYHNK
ncbi:YbbR-like domain-containing protein [Candidatus Epulonipiscium viviparus]|uniref:CdaR family protein n=1 Tax=Candidatus Epulonipiscium viviparus TaxID=420336 RepID=UPI00016BFF0C|nr:CdaR family protein [Candidatus Epulopiscium viviparus]